MQGFVLISVYVIDELAIGPKEKKMKCTSLTEVRTQIDALDKQLIALLAKRQGYVTQAAGFKTDAAAVPAPERAAAVIEQAKTEARLVGASPEVVEAVYRAMIGEFIAYEHELLARRSV